jgi:predicted TIM-barrel fold metal-dependent hydrolase
MSIAKPPRGVDCHAHVFSADAPAAAQARYRPAYEARLEDWMAHWPAAGITHGVLVQPSFFGTDNTELVAALARAPERLRGIAVVDADIAEKQLLALDKAGIRGIRLNLQSTRDYGAFAHAPWPLLFARMAALGWHVETFVEAGRAVDLAVALAGTSVDLVFDHFANPASGDTSEATFHALSILTRERSVWVKLSAPYRLEEQDPASLAAQWIDVLGSDRVVWGSDWPWTRHEGAHDYARLREDLDRWVGAERAHAILWDNAARLYRFA